jgi:chromate reductase
MQIKILALCGSSRRDSLNQKLLDIAALGAVDAGAQVSLIRWLDFPLPIYDGDWEVEYGLPECARALEALFAQLHALLIATPEHNGGYTALLKNALDWASRPSESRSHRPRSVCWEGRCFGLGIPRRIGWNACPNRFSDFIE